MMHFLEGYIFQIVKTRSLQRMPWSELITTYIHETECEMVLESVSRRLHVFYAILYVLKIFFKILLHSFQTKITVLRRESTKSGHTLFMEYHVLKECTTWIYRCWVIVAKKCLTHILSALCCFILFQFLRHFFKSVKRFRKLDEIQSCSLSIWFYPNLGKRRPEPSAGVME